MGSTPTARTTGSTKRSGANIADGNDDPFGEGENQAVEDFDRLTDLLFRHISEFADDEGVSDDLLPLLLLRLSLTTRMMAYATSVTKPSTAGLKLDLDRFRTDTDTEDMFRAMKKDADGFITRAGAAMRWRWPPRWKKMRIE